MKKEARKQKTKVFTITYMRKINNLSVVISKLKTLKW